MTNTQGRNPRRHDSGAVRIESLTLLEIESILSSDAHYAATQTRNYGERDPLHDPADCLFRCPCGNTPVLNYAAPPPNALRLLSRPLSRGDGNAFYVGCPACGKVGQPSLRDWRAVIDWNYLTASVQAGSLGAVPYFNLAGLTAQQAKDRLNSIKYDLSLRRAQAKMRREQGDDVGGRFLARIDAYLGWANVAIRVLTTSPSPAPDLVHARPQVA
ncbi:hypothetical protein [Ottowia sp.]|uniref:hypothetical protein n=1 Tax=Ottowia sp. TaxID=1898956 RepID=UPI0025DC0BF2|nr:hypothetical protein [Ottowia sp.]MBK6616272.1 hypothetical protein [Ottowia sp.]